MENLEIKPIKLITLTEFNDLLLGNQERLEYKRMLTILTQIFGPIETIKPINVCLIIKMFINFSLAYFWWASWTCN